LPCHELALGLDLPGIEELPIRAEIIGKHVYDSVSLEDREFLFCGTPHVEQQGLDKVKGYLDVAFERDEL
jgi:hypothetical protein